MTYETNFHLQTLLQRLLSGIQVTQFAQKKKRYHSYKITTIYTTSTSFHILLFFKLSITTDIFDCRFNKHKINVTKPDYVCVLYAADKFRYCCHYSSLLDPAELNVQPDVPDDPLVLFGFQMLRFISSELNGSKMAVPSAAPSSATSAAFPPVGLGSTLVFSSPQKLYAGELLHVAGGWFQKFDDAAGPGDVFALCWFEDISG